MKLPNVNNLPKLGSLWMLVAALGFATMGALVKVGAAKFNTAELVFYRSIFGLMAIYMVMRMKGLPVKTPVFATQMSRAIAGYLSLILYFYAIAHLPLATAITLNNTSGLFLAGLMPFFLHEKPKKTLVIALFLGFIGVVLLLQPSLNRQNMLAGLVGLVSGFGAAIAYTSIKKLAVLNEPDWRTVFYFTLVSTLGSGIWMLFQTFTPILWQDLPVLVGLGVSATIAQLALTRAYRTGKTLTVASLAYVTVIIASFFGVLFWQEHLSLAEWLGIGLIILSGVISIKTTSENASTTK